uniref:Uncharacterized protein n=1 Tax=Anopheles dirus TaxID=7168 RepID=A0A182NPW6_9DIPT
MITMYSFSRPWFRLSLPSSSQRKAAKVSKMAEKYGLQLPTAGRANTCSTERLYLAANESERVCVCVSGLIINLRRKEGERSTLRTTQQAAGRECDRTHVSTHDRPHDGGRAAAIVHLFPGATHRH